jgi:hypothetical protein
MAPRTKTAGAQAPGKAAAERELIARGCGRYVRRGKGRVMGRDDLGRALAAGRLRKVTVANPCQGDRGDRR